MGNLRERFGNNLTLLRKSSGFSRDKLCEKINLEFNYSIDPLTIRNYEKGIRWPDPEKMEVLAKALGTSTDELLNVDGNKLPEPTLTQSVGVVLEAIDLIRKIPPECLEILKRINWKQPNINCVLETIAEAIDEAGTKKVMKSRKDVAG